MTGAIPSVFLAEFPERGERIRYLLLLCFVFLLPYDMVYSTVILVTLIVATVLDLNREKLRRIPRQVLIFQAPYFLAICGYLYSYHRGDAGFLLERQLSILLLPVILPMAIVINSRRLKLMIATLAITCFIAVCYLFTEMIYTILFDLKLPLARTSLTGAFFNHQFSSPIGIHAGYLSLYVSFSIMFLVHALRTGSSIPRWIKIVMLLVLFAGLFFLASRNTIIATFFILLFVFPFFRAYNRLNYFMILFALFGTAFILIMNVPYLKDRFFIELVSDIKPVQGGLYINYNSAEPRYERWRGAWELIRRSPVFGYGTGDEIVMLKTEYIKRGLYISYLENFNAHNQYLSYLIKNGIVGLLLFIAAFIYYLMLAFRSRDALYISFLILLAIGFYTENILDVNKGIFFFAMFNTLLGYNDILRTKELKAAGKIS